MLDSMPVEVLLNIAIHLDAAALCQMACVCSRFSQVVRYQDVLFRYLLLYLGQQPCDILR
jgi:hypothetical protein